MKVSVAIILLCSSTLLCSIAHAISPNSDATSKAIKATEQLVNESVSAKKIISSGKTEAIAVREKAISILGQAKKANERGDNQATLELLNQAKKTFFGAIRLVGNGVISNGKKQRYKNSHKSVVALLEALKNIDVEKNVKKESREIEKYVQESILNSEQLFKDGKLDAALDTIEKAYLSVKVNIKRLRNGETLVRELHFETKQDEYIYEQDRNHTHHVLIDVVLKEKLKDPKISKRMAVPLEKSRQLKQQAEQEAAKGDFETAVKILEESTRQLIRAIRAAGIYIPG